MDNKVIELDNVTKKYKLYKNDKERLASIFFKKVRYTEKTAVENISFSINKGETVALLGENGAGKSTILKMITGVTFPTTGNISVKGRVSALLELKSGLDESFTGRENIYLKGQILGLDDEKIQKLEKSIIKFAKLGEYIDQPIRTYSSGMKTRLGFSINVHIIPQILIIDESLSVGDGKFKKKCQKKIRNIIEKRKVTLLFVTHSTELAKDFCERGIVLRGGKLIFDGNIDDAIKKYEKSII